MIARFLQRRWARHIARLNEMERHNRYKIEHEVHWYWQEDQEWIGTPGSGDGGTPGERTGSTPEVDESDGHAE